MEKEKRKKNGRRKKENSTELQKPNVEAEMYNNYKKKVRKKVQQVN